MPARSPHNSLIRPRTLLRTVSATKKNLSSAESTCSTVTAPTNATVNSHMALMSSRRTTTLIQNTKLRNVAHFAMMLSVALETAATSFIPEKQPAHGAQFRMSFGKCSTLPELNLEEQNCFNDIQ